MAEFKVQETVVGLRDCGDCGETVAPKKSNPLLGKILILDVDLLVSHWTNGTFLSGQVRRNDTLAIKIPTCLSIALPAVEQ